ncbi:hypothetical protein GUJ93_ZPchr0004g39369 [Zizania palustris]|uniref:Uncharacterized protein n=1 Tax=Zizania palustris TaxID=103762 RepID=A0A8J5T0Z5_ZIZPA|nr:hypothetical protein GUJ93_ZPchr0004g39369 [Zizania palustris]
MPSLHYDLAGGMPNPYCSLVSHPPGHPHALTYEHTLYRPYRLVGWSPCNPRALARRGRHHCRCDLEITAATPLSRHGRRHCGRNLGLYSLVACHAAASISCPSIPVDPPSLDVCTVEVQMNRR